MLTLLTRLLASGVLALRLTHPERAERRKLETHTMPVAGSLLAGPAARSHDARGRICSRALSATNHWWRRGFRSERAARKQTAAFVPKLLSETSSRRKTFLVLSVFCCAHPACLERLTNEQHRVFPTFLTRPKLAWAHHLPGQAKLGRRHICKAARVASTPPPANPRNSQGPYMWVFFLNYHIWPQKRIALAGRGAKPRKRQYAS